MNIAKITIPTQNKFLKEIVFGRIQPAKKKLSELIESLEEKLANKKTFSYIWMLVKHKV